MDLGVDTIEAGFAAASPDDLESIRRVSLLSERVMITSLCRALRSVIDQAWTALKDFPRPRLHVFAPSSDIQIQWQLRTTRDKLLERALDAVRHARSLTGDVQFSAMDATRADRGFLMELYCAASDAGASMLNISDTTGYIMPAEVKSLVSLLSEKVKRPGISLSIHCHNDLGLATANTIAAVEAGIDQIEVTLCGIGERAGNASMQELIRSLPYLSGGTVYETDIIPEAFAAAEECLWRIISEPC
jgi:2-isopropylmalate synthase